MSATASWKFVCTCAWRPGVPNTRRGVTPSRAITVLRVWIGLLPGASTFGDAATRAHERSVEEPLHIEPRLPRIARVCIAVGERHLLDLDHLVHEVGAAPGVLLHVEPLGDRELLQQDVALRDGRLPENAEAAIGNGDRPRAIGRMGGEIVERDVPAECRQRLREAGAEIATV